MTDLVPDFIAVHHGSKGYDKDTLEETNSGYVTVYASDEKGGNAGEDSVKNIFLTYTPKSDFSEKATKTKKLTSYGKTTPPFSII